MKQNKKSTVIFIVVVAIIIILGITFLFISKTLKSIPDNPKGTLGNTPGNIYNSGYFCEDNGLVYFANSYDYNSIYVMNPDETGMKKLVSANTKYINAGGNYLYYYMSDSGNATGLGFVRRVMGIYRSSKNGKRITTISRDPSLEMILIDNDLYYQHYDNTNAVTLYKCDTEGKKETMVSKSVISPAGVYDDIIYFTNPDNLFLMILDTNDNSIVEYKNYKMWNPVRQDEYIYFMDISNNYCLSRYSIEKDTIEILYSGRIDCFNLNSQYIYFQTNSTDSPSLKRVSLDGTTEEIVANGTYTAINITSEYVYFRLFENQDVTYRTPAYGSINVKEFEVAKDIAFQ